MAIGYWYNDLATWWSGVLAKVGIGPDKQQTTSGKMSWWFILSLGLVFGVILLVVYMVLGMITGKGRKKMFLLIGLTVLARYLDSYFGLGGGDGMFYCELLGSIAASSSGTIKSNYLPEIVLFNISSAPTVFQVEVTGDGTVCNFDADGVTNMNGLRQPGSLPSNQYIYQLANGYVTKNTQFTITNAAAAQLDVYGFSTDEATHYMIYQQAKAFANSSLRIPGNNFLYLAFPDAAATDRFTITWRKGNRTTSPLFRNELESYLAWYQQVTATRYNIDNFQQLISQVQFQPGADQTVYWARMQRVGAINQSLL